MRTERLSLWLQPEPAAAAELDAVIARLAAVHHSAVFTAHLSLLQSIGRQSIEQGAPAAVGPLDQVAGQLSPLAVTFTETRCEQAWHRSLYLAAVAEPALRRAFDVAVLGFQAPGDQAFEPHLSLQYSQLPIADKRRLAAGAAIDLPRTIRFDRLSLWHTTGADASRWRLLASRRLAENFGQPPSRPGE